MYFTEDDIMARNKYPREKGMSLEEVEKYIQSVKKRFVVQIIYIKARYNKKNGRNKKQA